MNKTSNEGVGVVRAKLFEGLLVIPWLVLGIVVCVIDRDVREMVNDELKRI